MNVNELKRKRINLQMRIKEWVDKGKNAKDLVNEYHILLDELRKNGIKAEIKADYLHKSYWENEPTKITPIKSNKIDQRIKAEEPRIKPTQDSFILCLAWTDVICKSTPAQIKKVMDYFNELCLPLIDEEVNHIDNRTEHILKYEFKGSEESFRLLKLCTQFVLDAFAQTDFEKFNIAIFGKKKNF